jgi:GNAT superfamily N-acetyltransferase
MKFRIEEIDDPHNDLRLLELQKKTLPGDWPLVPEKGSTFWIAFAGRKPVAFASLSPLHAEKDCGHLSRCGVLKAFRGKGLQKQLIAARVKKAKEEGWTHVVSDTRAWNSPSINSLIASGFRSYIPKRPWMASGTCYWLRKV